MAGLGRMLRVSPACPVHCQALRPILELTLPSTASTCAFQVLDVAAAQPLAVAAAAAAFSVAAPLANAKMLLSCWSMLLLLDETRRACCRHSCSSLSWFGCDKMWLEHDAKMAAPRHELDVPVAAWARRGASAPASCVRPLCAASVASRDGPTAVRLQGSRPPHRFELDSTSVITFFKQPPVDPILPTFLA